MHILPKSQGFNFSILLTLKSEVSKLFSMKGQIVNMLGFLGHTVSITTTQPCCCREKPAIEWVGALFQQNYLWTLKFEFHIIFTCWKRIFSFLFFQPLKSLKAIVNEQYPLKCLIVHFSYWNFYSIKKRKEKLSHFNLCTIQKLTAGQIWSKGCCLSTIALKMQTLF